MVPRIMLYILGGLAGTMLGAGISLHLVREDGLSQPLAGAFTGCIIAVFLGLAHVLARTVIDSEEEPLSREPAAPPPRPSPPPCVAWLIPTATTGGGPRVAYPLQKSCTLIGRDVENDVMINSASISRSHAQIVRMEGSYLVLDLDSRNGTFVNGDRVVQKQLHDGDELVLGSIHFRIRIEDFNTPRREEAPPADAPAPRDEWTSSGGARRSGAERQEWASESGGRRGERQDWASESGGRRGERQEWASESGGRRGERQEWASESGGRRGERQDWASESGGRRGERQDWASESGGRRGEREPRRRETWGEVTADDGSWTAAARDTSSYPRDPAWPYEERRRPHNPIDPPFPPERDRRRRPYASEMDPRRDERRRRPEGEYPPPPPPPDFW